MSIVATGTSQRNTSDDKPNEDVFTIRSDNERTILVIADGVTRSRRADGRYPVPSGGLLAARVVAQTLIAALVNAEHLRALYQAFRQANDAVAQLNHSHNVWPHLDYEEHDLYGAVATAAVIHDKRLIWAHIGDTALLKIRGGHLHQLTRDQVQKSMKFLKQLTPAERAGKSVAYHSRAQLRNHPELPVSYGVLTGEDMALDYVETGEDGLIAGDVCLLCSDAVTCLRSEEEDWSSAEQLLAGVPFLEWPSVLIAAAGRRELEAQLRSDDKTIIVARVAG
ncbi:MAG: protein phosphatase 2C domain-containing protein [Chloroflexi bacterium]|nr:protein phosphatase 2C domain-containing protein [Chloroflexota bacterium]